MEPFTLHSPLPSLLAGVWMASRESELAGNVSRAIKEAIAASVSKLNKCPYCVDAHTIMIRATGENKLAQYISKEQYERINPVKIRRIVKWTLNNYSPDSRIITNPPFELEEAPEIIGTAIFYHYINPLVTIFLGNSPLPIPYLKTPMKIIASRLFKKAVNRSKNPGASLILLPEKELPNDLFWAKNSPNVSGAFARFAGVIEELEKEFVPKKTQNIVKESLLNWNGESRYLEISSYDDDLQSSDSGHRFATKLALFSIFSPYKIDQRMINNYQRFFPQPTQLLGLVAWASFSKASRIGKWLMK